MKRIPQYLFILLLINSGRPRIITDIESLSSATINLYLPGNYGGDALSDILVGKVNPSGKLPYSNPSGWFLRTKLFAPFECRNVFLPTALVET